VTVIDGKRVVAFTPYGREVTVSVLAEYMRREHERGILDEWWLCLNTDPDQTADLVYGYRLAKRYPWIKAMKRPAGLPRLTPKQRNTGYFYRYMTDADSVFVRFDDDIVYLHEDALTRLVRKRIQLDDSTLAAFAYIWNNAICSWYGQQHGVIPLEYGKVQQPFCMDPMGWANGPFAVKIHHLLLDHAEAGTADRLYLYQDVPLAPQQQFSVSCFATSGGVYAGLDTPGVLVPDEEEHWHTVHGPKRLGLGNVIIGDALVSHLTFMNQRHAVLDPETGILDRYRKLATKLAS
jgi:hypothetical protein